MVMPYIGENFCPKPPIYFKQFTNAQHEYNEHFNEGDLVLFGRKFTLDGEKLMVRISI